MNTSSPCTTPSRTASQVSTTTVSPVKWMHAFAYTPESSGYQEHEEAARDQMSLSDDDALPTLFTSRARPRSVCHVLHPDRTPVDELEGYAPQLVVSTKRKCKEEGRNTVPLSTPIRESFPVICNASVTRRFAGRDWDPYSSQSSTTEPTRRQSRHAVLDAAEIVRNSWSRGRVVGPRSVRASQCLPDSACESTYSHYPSPPISPSDDSVVAHDNSSHSTHLSEHDEPFSPELGITLKTSKYFTHISNTPHSVRQKCPILTPPPSPIFTAALPPSEMTCYSQGLFDDLMVMLRRLKPILIQESVQDDPWKVLIAVRLLNVTTGKAAIPVFCKLVSRWPTPLDMMHAQQDELVELLRPLGLYNKRANWLKDISERFLEDGWAPGCSGAPLVTLLSAEGMTPAVLRSRYPGVGSYALDSLRIFCASDKKAWKQVMPSDKELVRYLRWRWAVDEGKQWYPNEVGVIGDVDVPYLMTVVDELAAHYDDSIGGEGYMYHFCNDLSEALSGNGTGVV